MPDYQNKSTAELDQLRKSLMNDIARSSDAQEAWLTEYVAVMDVLKGRWRAERDGEPVAATYESEVVS